MKIINFILLIGVVFITACNSDVEVQDEDNDTTVVEKTTVEEVEFTQEQLDRYYMSYEDPFVLHIRISIDNYLAGNLPPNEEFITESFIEYEEYIKNKFIVLSINDGIMGGKEIGIIFPGKPDKTFWVWVYKLGDSGIYELRTFDLDNSYTEEEINKLQIQFKFAFEDEEHSL